MSNEDSLSLIESRALKGGNNLLVHVGHSKLSVFPFFLFSSFSFSVFTYLLRFSPRCCYYRVRDAPLTVHGKGPLYSACYDRILPFQPLTTFVQSGCSCRPLTDLLVTQPPPFICAGRATRQRRLFCLFACRGTLICYGVAALSLPIPHGMHLVVPAHLCFLQVVCHSSKTFPPKEPEQKTQNRFSLFPIARPCPLTSDP